ncbi:MAG: 6-phosphofructokinase [Clostridia bacterium]|nr:6-phosphofructokinase [Clostridia bacterium]
MAFCGNAVVGQSGGPTAAINATLAGVIRGAKASDRVDRIFGMKNGVEGLIEDRLIDVTDTDEASLSLLEDTPASALGSCRRKLPDVSSGDPVYGKIFEVFRRRNIRFFFYIGGNDSMDAVAKLSEYVKSQSYEMCVVGIPKTIDNDLKFTDHTPGYGSAAKYIATTMQEIVRDCSVYTVKAMTVVEIMGRDSGWLTAAAGLTGYISGAAPAMIYLPEVPFSAERYFEDLGAAFGRAPFAVVAVSEGIRFADGRYVGEGMQSGSVDAFGHKYLSGAGRVVEAITKERFGCKTRSVELNLMQRCASHLASATDIEESAAIGQAAVEAATESENALTGVMAAFIRRGGKYGCDIVMHDIKDIANEIKTVPREYINERGNGVTKECCEYILPLIQGERKHIFENGIPKHFSFR